MPKSIFLAIFRASLKNVGYLLGVLNSRHAAALRQKTDGKTLILNAISYPVVPLFSGRLGSDLSLADLEFRMVHRD
jgi:hypothetical protein